MNYSLGNMLSRGGALNPDGLALDLQFAADKTLTARRGPTPTFTRASTATFVGSNGLIQTAAINAPRFDHDPVTLASRGLLIEESRTNLALRSEEFDTASWTKFGCTISANAGESPTGGNSADNLVENTSTGFHGMTQIVATVVGTVYTWSFFVKANGRNFALIYSGAGGASGRYISIPADGSGAVLGNFNANNAVVSMQYFGNGWYRVSQVFTATATLTGVDIYASTNGTSASYTGSGNSSILVWGAQLELGSFPTSYIPTTTAAVVRSADVCSITGSDFSGFYNQSEGTIVGSGLTNQPTTNPTTLLFRSSDGTENNRVQVGMTNVVGQAVRPFITSLGTTTYNNNNGTASVGVERKVGTAYKTNDAISAFNGTLGTLDTTVTLPTNTNQAILFTNFGAGTISSLRYFKKRLSNEKLQSLTT